MHNVNYNYMTQHIDVHDIMIHVVQYLSDKMQGTSAHTDDWRDFTVMLVRRQSHVCQTFT